MSRFCSGPVEWRPGGGACETGNPLATVPAPAHLTSKTPAPSKAFGLEVRGPAPCGAAAGPESPTAPLAPPRIARAGPKENGDLLRDEARVRRHVDVRPAHDQPHMGAGQFVA